MRLRGGDVLGPEAPVEADRGVDLAHDVGPPAAEAAAPQGVGATGLFCAGHREVAIMRWGCTAAFSILIAVSGAGAAADDAFLPEHTKLGEFIATAPPLPAPPTAFTDLQGNPVRLADFTGK